MNRTGHAAIAALLLCASILIASCAGMGSFAEGAYYGEGYDAGYAEPAPAMADDAPKAARSLAVTTGGVAPGTEGVSIADQLADGTSPEPVRERLRVYSADLDLGVASVEQAREAVISLAEDSGGYVESSQSNYIVIRVPAAAFDRILRDIETLGSIRSRAIRTSDVTDQFFDLERRLEIAVTARDRLNFLLQKTDDADERVAILREIRRLTEEIERLRASFDSLSQLIAYSRVAVRLTPLIQEVVAGRSRIPFDWIARLAPLTQTTGEAAFRIPVEIPDGFAVFSEGAFVMAEAADGTKIRIGAVPNDPVGDAQFWARALEFHLGPYYQSVQHIEAGSFRGVVLESKDREPYHYVVVVSVIDGDGIASDELMIAEVFFPAREALESRSDEISAMLAEVEL